MTNKSDGSTARYYELPPGCTELQDLISHRNMNAQDGEIFRAIYRKGRASHSDELRDAKKVLFYAQAEVKRLEQGMAMSAEFGQQHTIEPEIEPFSISVKHKIEPRVINEPDGALRFGCTMVEVEPASLIDDESPRQQLIQQSGEMAAEVYSEIDRLRAAEAFNADLPVTVEEAIALGAVPQREPCQPRHRCQTCAGGHSTHECGAGL